MSDEFCAGVKILLKRVESHPEEFTAELSPWRRLVDAVLAHENCEDSDIVCLRALTQTEITALHKALLPLARQEFDSWVMSEVLAEPKEEKHWAAKQMAQGWTDPRMNVPPGTMISVTAGGSGGSGQVKLGGIREKEREGVMRRIQNSIKELRKQTP